MALVFVTMIRACMVSSHLLHDMMTLERTHGSLSSPTPWMPKSFTSKTRPCSRALLGWSNEQFPFNKRYGIWVWNPFFCQSFNIYLFYFQPFQNFMWPPNRLVQKSCRFFDSGNENPRNPHSSHSQKMDWKTKGSWILFLGALKGQNLANGYLVPVRFNKLYHVFLYDLL